MAAERPWRKLGELLIARGLIDRYELEYALAEQRLCGLLLGEVLVSRGLIRPDELAAVLAEQRDDGASGPREGGGARARMGRRPLGRFLADKGLITESGLQRALMEQRRRGGMLGEILVRRGYITTDELASALAEQEAGVGNETAAEIRPAEEAPPAAASFEVWEVGQEAAEPDRDAPA